MSVITSMVAPVDDRWPPDRRPADHALEEVLFASHLLGSNRAVANYGGGNTSAKGIAVDHVGREVRAMWVKGSGSDLATMSASDFTPLRFDEILPLFERDAMSDEEMVSYLARCQLDPRRRARRSRRCCTRSSRQPTFTTPIPTRSTCSRVPTAAPS